MATQLEDFADDGDEQDFEEADTDQDDAPDDEAEGAEDEGDEQDGADDDAGDDESDVISFGGTDIRDEDEPEHISDLRRRYREEKRMRQELEAKLAPRVEDIGPEPNMDDYWERDDPGGEFKRDLLAWNAKKQAAQQRESQQREEAEKIQREYETDVATFETQRSALRVRDFDAAQERVASSLSEPQQAILTQVAKNKAALWYALGKNTDRLAALAKVTNLAKFAGEVARLDMETRVSRKPNTKPEGTVRGSGTFNGKAAGDAKLARLEAEAAKTGDYSAIAKYRYDSKRQKTAK